MRSTTLTSTLCALVLAAPALHAAELTVGPGQQFATIQSAIDAAAATGDSIRVFPFTYFENLFIFDKDIQIFSDSNDFNNTIIDGALGANSVVRIVGNSSGSLEGFTVQNGNALAGGGILTNFNSPLVRNGLIRQNRAELGAGLFAQGGAPRFEDCRFFANVCQTGTPGLTPSGAGMYVDQCQATFVDCRIDSNFSPGEGGGIWVRNNLAGGAVGASFEGCLIQFNRASWGGGIAAISNTSATFTRCEIINNLADLLPETGNTNYGGGDYSRDACPQYTSCVIAENRVGDGSVLGRIGKGGGIYQEGFGFLNGGFLCETVVENCTIADNDAGVIPQNTGFGGGICTDKSLTFVRNSIVWGNTAQAGSGDQIAVLNTPPSLSGTFVTTTVCDLQGGPGAVYQETPAGNNYVFNNVLNVNPQFIGGSDFHLLASSPMIEAGDPAITPTIGSLDLDGDPRLLNVRLDLGMDEFVDCTIVTFYGPLTPNSAGPGAQIALVGSTSVSANNAVLQVSGGPPGKAGIFLYGPTQKIFPLGMGNLLVGGQIQRVNSVLVFDGAGNVSLPVDWTQPPFNGLPNPIVAGSSWNFQFWFRDNVGGMNTTNLSDAMHITFCP